MKIQIDAFEIVDADITKVSLVKRGANRTPFKIVKTEQLDPYEVTWRRPDNGEAAGAAADPRYPLGRPHEDLTWLIRKDHSLDAMEREAVKRVAAGKAFGG